MTKNEEIPKVDFKKIEEARKRIKDFVHYTPVFTNLTLNKEVSINGPDGIEIFCKGEFLQKTGSFKARGALNSVLSLKERDAALTDPSLRAAGVVTESSGNNGMALSWAAAIAGLPCTVVLHEGASPAKRNIIASHGAELRMAAATLTGRKAAVAEVVAAKRFVAVYDSDDLIAGQGTIALEFLEQVPDLDAILVPTSGGGMASGICVAAKALNPGVKIYIVEPEGKDSEKSLRAGQRLWERNELLDTIGDGFRMPYLGPRTWHVLLEHVEKEVFTVTDEEMIEAMKFVYQRMKLVIEVTAAAGVAAVMSARFKQVAKARDLRKVGVILCGGNADLDKLPWVKN